MKKRIYDTGTRSVNMHTFLFFVHVIRIDTIIKELR